MKRVAGVFTILFLCLVCLLLGTRMLQHGDFFYLSDQARDYILVRDIITTHKLTLIGSHSGLGGLFHGPLWLYILVPIFIVGKGNPLAFAYWYALMPILTILVGYGVANKLYNRQFGFLVAFLLSVNSILWGYINNTIGINLMPLLYILFLYGSIAYIRGNQKAFIAVAFLAGLAFQFETASAIALLPIVVFVAVLNKNHYPRIKIILYSLIFFVISLSTFILFDLRHHFLILTSSLSIFNQHGGHKDYTSLAERILDHLNSLKDAYLSPLFMPTIFLEILLVGIIGYFLYLMYKKIEHKQPMKELLFYAISPCIVFVLFMAYPHPIYKEYVLDLTVSLIFALVFIFKIIIQKPIGKILATLFLLTTTFYVVNYLYTTYTTHYIADASSGSYKNQKQVVNWIFKDANNKPFGYFVYTPETFTYGMDYLLWYQSKKDNLPLPEGKKLSQTYLILYPALANDANAHTFWIKNTIHTLEKPEEVKVFPGGIIVEKMNLENDTTPVDPNYYQNLIFR